MKNLAALALGVAGAAVAAAPAIADTRVSFASGVNYSSGDYGETIDTEVVSVPLSARLITDNWSFGVATSYQSITGPADVADTTDGGGGGGGATIARQGTEQGLGDTTLSATHSFRRLGGSRAYFDLGVRVRVPTGDEDKGLGVGATDYTLGAELGNSSAAGGGYISAGRRFLGDRDGSASPREDGWQGGVGGWLRAGENTRVGASYWWREATFAGGEQPSGVSAYVSYRLNDDLRLSVSGGAGLSEAAADYMAGIRLIWRSDAMGD